ncbi:WD repeat-containing protein 82 [Mortierella alpina]|uniref:WD repeat-containing protein 82 n=1 Tax=Mortierella alpina TaxID=64518 RepID=A0A9P6J2B4_MORAP|nr:WD repeat-containing protein 82 [Mortierella alpina]
MAHQHITDYTAQQPQPPPQTQPQLQAQAPAPIVLTPALLGSLKVAKIFKDNTQIITSLDFDDTGGKCVTSAQDESLHVYDCVTGKVTALEMSPLDDQFLAGSEDAIRLWDLRSPTCQGAVSIVGRPAVAFDPSGLVFAVALGSTLRLYDVKSFDQGPFSSATIGENLGVNPAAIVATQLEFSSDGKYILVTTAADAHYIIDAYHPKDTCFRLVGHYSYGNELFSSGEEACWTPDGKSVVSGSRDGGVYVWDIARAIADRAAAGLANGSGITNTSTTLNGLSTNSLLSANRELKPFKVLKAHGTPSHIVAFNPKYLMMVSGSTELAFWEPDPNLSSVGGRF